MKQTSPWRFLVANRIDPRVNGVVTSSQRKFRFPNGFGASVVKRYTQFAGWGVGTYGAEHGRYELAVLAWDSEESASLTYDTPITRDVIGHLTAEEVETILFDIMNLWIVTPIRVQPGAGMETLTRSRVSYTRKEG